MRLEPCEIVLPCAIVARAVLRGEIAGDYRQDLLRQVQHIGFHAAQEYVSGHLAQLRKAARPRLIPEAAAGEAEPVEIGRAIPLPEGLTQR